MENPRSALSEERVRAAIRASTDALFSLQNAEGSWPSRRPPGVSATGGALLGLHFADPVRSADLIATGAAWLLRARNPDGGWGTLLGSSTDFVSTATVATALALTAPEASEQPVRQALEVLRARGGVEGVGEPTVTLMTGLVLSLAGLYDARRLPRVPLELVLLPTATRRRLLSYVTSPFVMLALLQAGQHPGGAVRRRVHQWVRPTAVRLLEEIQEQEGNVGTYGGDPWLTGLVCTALHRLGEAPHLVTAAVDYLRRAVRPDGAWNLMHGIQSTSVPETTGTALVTASLSEAGYTADPRLVRAREWLYACQLQEPFALYDCPPGGWAWLGPKGWPGVLDSLAVMKALALAAPGDARLLRGVEWLRGRQDGRGSWSTFVRDALLPNDGPCAYSTFKAIDVLLDVGASASDPHLARAVRWVLKRQRADGSYDAVWNRGGVPATSAAVRVLPRLGLGQHPVARRARQWLLSAQRPDGSWGTGRDSQPGTPEETGWAVRALVACGEEAAVARGVDWLVAAQGADGFWSPGQVCVYIRDHVLYVDNLYAQGLALGALVASGHGSWARDEGKACA
jgi:squalene-hopene/tetraprenyl-beta-curcumene cyclase